MKYTIPTEWKEITIGRYADFIRLCEQLNIELEALFGEVRPSNIDILLEFPDYFYRLLAFWANMPMIEARNMNRDVCYQQYKTLEKFITLPKPNPVSRFSFKGNEYRAPQDKSNPVTGVGIPMGQCSFGDFTEATQYYHATIKSREQQVDPAKKKNAYDSYAGILAIVFKQPGEAFEETMFSDREKMFRQLPVLIVNNAVGFFFRSMHTLKTITHFEANLRQKNEGPESLTSMRSGLISSYYN